MGTGKNTRSCTVEILRLLYFPCAGARPCELLVILKFKAFSQINARKRVSTNFDFKFRGSNILYNQSGAKLERYKLTCFYSMNFPYDFTAIVMWNIFEGSCQIILSNLIFDCGWTKSKFKQLSDLVYTSGVEHSYFVWGKGIHAYKSRNSKIQLMIE